MTTVKCKARLLESELLLLAKRDLHKPTLRVANRTNKISLSRFFSSTCLHRARLFFARPDTRKEIAFVPSSVHSPRRVTLVQVKSPARGREAIRRARTTRLCVSSKKISSLSLSPIFSSSSSSSSSSSRCTFSRQRGTFALIRR